MSTIITTNFSTEIAQQFYNLMDVSANDYLPDDRKSYLYCAVGRELPWNDGQEIEPTPGQATRDFITYYDEGIVARRLTLNDVSFVIPRIDWTSNTAYAQYGCTVCPINTNFYVLNSKRQVFKCLDNNGGINSTYEPEISLSTTSLEEPYFVTGDGYKWKYMYTLTTAQQEKYLTSRWMPVTYNRFVRNAAINRSIDIVRITNAGNNYVDGSLQSIISIDGDGAGAVLRANVANGHVTNIIIQDRGLGYTKANLIFTDVAGGIGSNAAASVVLSPQNGHGYNPVQELYANTIMFNVDFDGSESGVYPVENDFRLVYIIKNPYKAGTIELADSDLYTLYTKIDVSPGIGDYNDDEYVFQGDSFADATFIGTVISFDEGSNKLFLNDIRGTYNNNIPIKGNASGAIRIALGKTDPTLALYTGDILHVSEIIPISRSENQKDRIKFILSF